MAQGLGDYFFSTGRSVTGWVGEVSRFCVPHNTFTVIQRSKNRGESFVKSISHHRGPDPRVRTQRDVGIRG